MKARCLAMDALRVIAPQLIHGICESIARDEGEDDELREKANEMIEGALIQNDIEKSPSKRPRAALETDGFI